MQAGCAHGVPLATGAAGAVPVAGAPTVAVGTLLVVAAAAPASPGEPQTSQ